MRSTRSQTADKAIGSASIVNPGFTPVPSTATLAFFAAASSRAASRRLRGAGYAASSVVVTIGTRRLRISSNCGSTIFSDELVQTTATSGLVALIVRPVSSVTRTRSFRPASITSPRSRPTFCESTSTAPTILNPLRDAICRATSAPIGPNPTCITRIMAAIIGKIRPVPDRRVVLFLAAVFAVAAIGARGQSVQTNDTPEPGARSPRNANYDIDVRLDHAARTLSGRQMIRWRNTSAKPTSELQFHLYWNAWRNADSTWLRERKMARSYTAPPREGWGAMDVSSVRLHEPSGSTRDLTSHMRFIAPDDGNAHDQTVMAVPLGRSVEPNETIQVELAWISRIPRPVARTGYIEDFYFIAQWFPKLGVLEDSGWNTHQFHAPTEFYADFGVYDVRITVPSPF